MLLSKLSFVRYPYHTFSAGVPDGFGSTILCPEKTRKQFACGLVSACLPILFFIARFGNPCAPKAESQKNVLSSFAMLYFLPKTKGFPSGNRTMKSFVLTQTLAVC